MPLVPRDRLRPPGRHPWRGRDGWRLAGTRCATGTSSRGRPTRRQPPSSNRTPVSTSAQGGLVYRHASRGSVSRPEESHVSMDPAAHCHAAGRQRVGVRPPSRRSRTLAEDGALQLGLSGRPAMGRRGPRPGSCCSMRTTRSWPASATACEWAGGTRKAGGSPVVRSCLRPPRPTEWPATCGSASQRLDRWSQEELVVFRRDEHGSHDGLRLHDPKVLHGRWQQVVRCAAVSRSRNPSGWPLR
jgi:hypothetical protein